MLGHVNIKVGINRQVFNVIRQEVSCWNESKKMCSILFDMMKLETGVHYTLKDDKIHGFVVLTEKSNHLADHALTFILQGAVHKWQQPIAFYFSEGSASGPQMKAILKELVAAVCETGLQPIALISDQRSLFQRALKSLQEDTRRSQILAEEETDDTIHLNGQCLSVVYNPPHLLKGVRNHFLTKNIQMNGETSKWQDLVDVYRTDCRPPAQARLLHKLNDEQILPEKIKKIKVKNCVRVFSKTMAAALAYTASFSRNEDGTPVSATLVNTSKLVAFLDDLFDSVNGSSTDHKRVRGKPLRTAVTKNTQHHAFWRNAIKKIEDIKFVDQQGKIKSVPSLKNWVTTLKSYQRLWQVLRKKKVKIMRPRYFNLDAVENFFGRVRSYNDRNNDLTCHAFACTFKSLLVTNFRKFDENIYNSEDDCTEQVIKIKSLLYQIAEATSVTDGHTPADSVRAVPSSPSGHTERDAGAEQIRSRAARERLHVQSRAYNAGWVTRRVLRTFCCEKCQADFTTTEMNVHKWINKREFNTIKKNNLTYPSMYAVRSFGYIVKESNAYLERNSHRNNIFKDIKQILLSKYTFDFNKCETHRDAARECFIAVSVTLCIFNWCNNINQILKGTRLNFVNLPFMRAQALKKYNKKIKNKSLHK